MGERGLATAELEKECRGFLPFLPLSEKGGFSESSFPLAILVEAAASGCELELEDIHPLQLQTKDMHNRIIHFFFTSEECFFESVT